MFPNFNLIDFVMILLGVLFCFKRVVEMERYHDLRVIILTSVLGALALLGFIAFASTFDEPIQCDSPCADHFTLSEM